ncbi:ribosomal protein [Musa troglodytarum]|uniref:Ribosomal protein n=1 Tax=Musa troglodytarum TaxID=320322 RepID=A0A9E7ET57_9LILI|nr:ribosomal protein [Musa troglodytarum]
MRNRRYISRKGPPIVYGTEGSKIVEAFRAPQPAEVGSGRPHRPAHLLDSVSGTFDKLSEKKGYALPRPNMVNADLSKIINSDEVQYVVRPMKKEVTRHSLKKNPLENLYTLLKLNPSAKNARRITLLRRRPRRRSSKRTRTRLPQDLKFKCYLLISSNLLGFVLYGVA